MQNESCQWAVAKLQERKRKSCFRNRVSIKANFGASLKAFWRLKLALTEARLLKHDLPVHKYHAILGEACFSAPSKTTCGGLRKWDWSDRCPCLLRDMTANAGVTKRIIGGGGFKIVFGEGSYGVCFLSPEFSSPLLRPSHSGNSLSEGKHESENAVEAIGRPFLFAARHPDVSQGPLGRQSAAHDIILGVQLCDLVVVAYLIEVTQFSFSLHEGVEGSVKNRLEC